MKNSIFLMDLNNTGYQPASKSPNQPVLIKIKVWLKVVPVHAVTAHRESRGIAPPILNLNSQWICTVSFITWLLYFWGKRISGMH
jgi:hypothetical protein